MIKSWCNNLNENTHTHTEKFYFDFTLINNELYKSLKLTIRFVEARKDFFGTDHPKKQLTHTHAPYFVQHCLKHMRYMFDALYAIAYN